MQPFRMYAGLLFQLQESLTRVIGKCMQRCPTEGAVLGCDFAGIVVAIGSEVSPSRVKVGDAVAGLVHGCKSPQSF